MKVNKYLITIFGILVCAVSFNIFFIPYNIVPSNTAGIGIIFNKLFNLREELTIFLLSLMFILIGYIYLDKEEVKKAILGTILFPIFIALFKIILVNINLSIDNTFLASIVGGVSFGFGLGIIYRQNHFLGGFDVLNSVLSKYIKVNSIFLTLITDLLVVILGGIFLSFETFVYSLVAIFICRLMIEKISLGIGDNRSFYIITSHADQIKKMIVNELGHGATIMKGKGAYTNDDRYIVFAVIPKRDYYRLRENIKKIDKKAFFVVSSSYEVGGGK